ncbi:MAG: hypothetical protein AAGA70_15290 [Pseudomonadota bacterium]
MRGLAACLILVPSAQSALGGAQAPGIDAVVAATQAFVAVRHGGDAVAAGDMLGDTLQSYAPAEQFAAVTRQCRDQVGQLTGFQTQSVIV